jgi:large subunit ribosomal protein L30
MAKAKVEASAIQEKSFIKVTLVKSTIGRIESHKATVKGLGLRRMHHSVEVQDTPAIRGMINTVGYLLKVEG